MNQQIITAKYWLVAHIFLFNLFWPIPEYHTRQIEVKMKLKFKKDINPLSLRLILNIC